MDGEQSSQTHVGMFRSNSCSPQEAGPHAATLTLDFGTESLLFLLHS